VSGRHSARIGGYGGRPEAPKRHLLRQYLPRQVSLRDYSQDDLDDIDDIDDIAAELNGLFRQTLGFKTPSEALTEVLP